MGDPLMETAREQAVIAALTPRCITGDPGGAPALGVSCMLGGKIMVVPNMGDPAGVICEKIPLVNHSERKLF